MALIIVSPSVPPEVIARLSLSVQPLVFETGVVDYPYSTNGTVFLVGYEGKPYVVTTRHGLYPDNPPPICVFPSDKSLRLIPLNNVFFVPHANEPDDFMDLAIIEVDPRARTDPELNQATLINLALAFDPDWESGASNMEFFVIGYPCEKSSIDTDSQELRTDRVTLFGRYRGESSSPYLHLLQIENSQNLASFSGFSGSPVFMWNPSGRGRPTPLFCGMAIRGTVASGLIHFLAAAVLLDALTVKRKQHENNDV